MPTDKFVFDGKGKLPFNKMLNEAIEFGIERETPKLEPHQMIKVVVTKADDHKKINAKDKLFFIYSSYINFT